MVQQRYGLKQSSVLCITYVFACHYRQEVEPGSIPKNLRLVEVDPSLNHINVFHSNHWFNTFELINTSNAFWYLQSDVASGSKVGWKLCSRDEHRIACICSYEEKVWCKKSKYRHNVFKSLSHAMHASVLSKRLAAKSAIAADVPITWVPINLPMKQADWNKT